MNCRLIETVADTVCKGRLGMMGFPYLQYLSERGYLKGGKAKILDVGTQNLMNCSVEQLTAFVMQYRSAPIDDAVHTEIKRLQYFSVPRPGERTLFLAELLDLTDIEYQGIDICPAPSTEIVDLNWEAVPSKWRGYFDIVLNFGTMEHVIGQTNSLVFLHDALKVGGIFLHQPPSIGWVNHGYFTYHPQFYRDIAAANGYVIEDMWYASSGGGPFLDDSIGHRSPYDPLGADDFAPGKDRSSEYFNLNVVMRKTSDAPFLLSLELATSHSSVDTGVGSGYPRGAGSDPVQQGTVASFSSEAMLRELRSRPDWVTHLMHEVEAIPRGNRDELHPLIEAWLKNFALHYAKDDTLDTAIGRKRTKDLAATLGQRLSAYARYRMSGKAQ